MRRTISITEEVWQEMAKYGRFGETPNDVLKRVFGLLESSGPSRLQLSETQDPVAISPRTRRKIATKRMQAVVSDNSLTISFVDGPSREFPLPSRSDKNAIRATRAEAMKWGENSGASQGQIDAIKKALTDAGYHLTR